MKIYTALTITALLSTPLAVFADAGPEAAEKALVENRELIEKQVASLNLELAKFTKRLKDEKVSSKEKADIIEEIHAAFWLGFPDDCEELVQTLSMILKDKETGQGTQKWILQIFMTMGAKASKAQGAIEHHVVNGKNYQDTAMWALAYVAPKNVLFQKSMNDFLANPEPKRGEETSWGNAYMLAAADRLDDKIVNILLKEAERSGLYPPHLLSIAQHAENLSDANRKRFLEFVKVPTKKGYDQSVENYFRETMLGNGSKAMGHFAESLTVKGAEGMAAAFSYMHLCRLKKSEIKQLAPVLIDLMKKDDGCNSIAYLLSDLAADVPNNEN